MGYLYIKGAGFQRREGALCLSVSPVELEGQGAERVFQTSPCLTSPRGLWGGAGRADATLGQEEKLDP